MTTAPNEREGRRLGVARRVRGLMGELRLRGEDMAPRLGISQPTWSRRVNGHVPFSVDEIEQLAAIFAVDEAYLYGFTNERNPRPVAGGSALYAIRDSNPEPADLEHGAVVSAWLRSEGERASVVDFSIADGANEETREPVGGSITHMPLASDRHRADAPERDRLATVVLHPTAYAALTERSA